MPRAAYFKDFYTRDGVNRGRLLRQAVNQTEGALPHARRVVLQGVEGLILLVRPGVDRVLPRRIMGDLGCSMHVAEFLEGIRRMSAFALSISYIEKNAEARIQLSYLQRSASIIHLSSAKYQFPSSASHSYYLRLSLLEETSVFIS